MKSAVQKERELIIKLSGEGKSTYKIADTLGISQSKASFWVRRFRKTQSLENEPRSGRPTPLTKDKLQIVAKALRDKVVSVKNKAGFSSKEVLQLLEKEAGRTYTLRHAERLLHKIGLSLITPRTKHIRNDEKAVAKFRDEFKKKLDRSTWVFHS